MTGKRGRPGGKRDFRIIPHRLSEANARRLARFIQQLEVNRNSKTDTGPEDPR
jgi:hypothetical protein